MNCEKCQSGTMGAVSIFRFSGCLVAIGFSLLVPSVLALLGATAFGLVSCVTAGKTATDMTTKAKTETIAKLTAVPGLPEDIVAEFDKTGTVAPDRIAALPERQRREVERIVSLHTAGLAGTAIGAGMVGGVGGILTLATYAAGIPAFIIGLVLILRKKIWKCNSCGYIFERA